MNDIVQSEEKSALVFAFDMTKATSFRIFLKSAIKQLIFACEQLGEEHRMHHKNLPLFLIGMKAEMKALY